MESRSLPPSTAPPLHEARTPARAAPGQRHLVLVPPLHDAEATPQGPDVLDSVLADLAAVVLNAR